jgi:hypothetical protein
LRVETCPLDIIGICGCLVMMQPNPARRDKGWHYIALEIQRYTKHNMATKYLYGRVDDAWGILNPKRITEKYAFLVELFKE